MEGKPIHRIKVSILKRGKQVIVLLLICTLLLNLSACGGKDTASKVEGENEPIRIIYSTKSEELILANSAATLVLHQYIYARLKTEKFITMDLSILSKEELSHMVNELTDIWETTLLVANESEKIIDKIIPVLRDSQVNKISKSIEPSINLMASLFNSSVYASSNKDFDPKAWAENFTKKYDELKGGQTIKQLAKQLGTDAKSAYEQLVMAQEIINNDSMADGDFYDKLTKLAQGTKSACKVGLFVGGAIITGGGSLTALAGSSVTLGQAGSLVLGGVDCIVDVATTSSSIILGEKNHVTVGFEDIQKKLAPITAVLGFKGLDLNDAAGSIDYIGNSLADWFYEDKIMGIKIEDDVDKGTQVVVKPIDISKKTEVEIKEIIVKEGFPITEESTTSLDTSVAPEEVAETFKTNKEEIIALLEKLKTQLSKIVEGTEEVVENAAPGNLEEVLNKMGIDTLSGTYDAVITMTKVEVVYDSEDEEDVYRAEPDNSWIGTRVETEVDLLQEGDRLSMMGEEGEISLVLTYNLEQNKWINEEINPLGKVSFEADVTSTDDRINIIITQTATYEKSAVPDGINEVVFKMTKAK